MHVETAVAPHPVSVARTAYYCCGARAADARLPRPICGDDLAQRFMAGEGDRVYAGFAHMTYANATNVARHRLIDDLLRERLQADPALQVLLLGAGFDTRAFRLPGGRWTEIDQPAVIDVKSRVLPAAGAPNPLERVAVDFAVESIADGLRRASGLDAAAPVLVVLEGVSMYLDAAAWAVTARALRAWLPRHTLVCDLMDERFQRRYSPPMRERIEALGSHFVPAPADPLAAVEALGYRRLRVCSIPGEAAALGAIALPAWLLGSFLKPLRDGYCLAEFAPLPGA